MKDILENLKQNFDLSKIESKRHDLFFVSVPKEKATQFITYLKDYEGFTHLNFINAVDYLEEDIFQLVYMLQNHDKKVNLGVLVNVTRNEPHMTSMHQLWRAVDVYERELKEMFGIEFPGSPRQNESFVLEGWQDIPPMRRDFDTLKYSNETFFPRPGRTTHDPKQYMRKKLYPEPDEANLRKQNSGENDD